MEDSRIDDLETTLRRQVAAATRMLNDEGILGYSGHISVRLPRRDAILIQPREMGRGEVTPECLLVTDLEGALIAPANGPKAPDEIFIHTEILKARPDAGAVFHFHPETAILFTLADGVALQAVKSHAVRWGSGIPVHADSSKIVSARQGLELAATLGAHNAALMRAHGAVIVAEDVPAVTIDAIHFVENARAMYEAAMLGPVRPLTPAEMEEINRNTDRGRHVAKLWKYYLGRALAKGIVGPDWCPEH